MSAQATLTNYGQEPGPDMSADEWRAYFDSNDGDVQAIAEVTGIDVPTVCERLYQLGIDETALSNPYRLQKVSPEDIGLPPLGCGNCGEQAIGEHACPVCGFDPEGDRQDALCDRCGSREATFETDGRGVCDGCHHTWEVEWQSGVTGREFVLERWYVEDGRVIPLQKRPVDDGGDSDD